MSTASWAPKKNGVLLQELQWPCRHAPPQPRSCREVLRCTSLSHPPLGTGQRPLWCHCPRFESSGTSTRSFVPALSVVGRTISRSVDPVVEESRFPRPGHHISARAQEYLLHEGCIEDARVALLETVFVLIALQQVRASGVPSVRRANHIAPRGSARPLGTIG